MLNGMNHTHCTWQGDLISIYDTPQIIKKQIYDIVENRNNVRTQNHELKI